MDFSFLHQPSTKVAPYRKLLYSHHLFRTDFEDYVQDGAPTRTITRKPKQSADATQARRENPKLSGTSPTGESAADTFPGSS